MTSNQAAPLPILARLIPWLSWLVAVSTFFIEYILRTAPLAMVAPLMETFHVSYTQISTLSALFLYAYVAMQIPVGMVVDRFGIRLTLTLSAILCVCSNMMFAATTHFYLAQLSRISFGFAASFAFVSVLKLAANWFSARLFCILVGVTQAIGMVGGAMGASIIGRLVPIHGWQASVGIFTSILAVLVVLVVLLVRNGPTKSSQETTQGSVLTGLKIILTTPQSWIIACCAGFLYVPTGVFAELWGSYFLQVSHHIPEKIANDAIAMIYVGWAIGGALAGMLANKIGRRNTLRFSSFGCLVIIPTIIYMPTLSVQALYLLFMGYGICNSGLIAAYTAVAELHPKQYSGVALGFSNGMSVVIGALCIQVVGILQDYLSTFNEVTAGAAASNIRLAMSINVICLGMALLLSFWAQETYHDTNT